MPAFDYDLGVIGGGAAGLTVAAGAAQLGVKTLLVEKEPALGGDCLHYGCVPSKTLIRSAAVYQLLKTADRYGLPAIEPPAVDFTAVRARIQQVIARIQKHDSEERFCRLGVDVRFGAACFTDQHTVELDGRRLTAAKWVIATGSRASLPTVPGLDRVHPLTNREIFSLDRLPGSLIVLGGGPIAMEMAQAFCRLGSRVEVVQRSGQILSKEDQDLADLAMNALAGEGVTFHLNTTLVRAGEDKGMREIVFKDQTGKLRTLRAESVLVALGRQANLEGLGLEAIGVEHTAKGVKVDQRLRTTQPHIFACGDVTGAHQFTHAAGYEGGVVIANAVFRLPRKTDYTWLPWCTYTEPELASVGLNEKRARAASIDYTVITEEFAANDRSLAEGEDRGMLKLLLDKKERPLGVQILGPHAGELLGEWVAAGAGRVKIATLAAAVHPYPTLAEISKRAAGAVMAKKLFSAKVKKALSFFFSYQGRACSKED